MAVLPTCMSVAVALAVVGVVPAAVGAEAGVSSDGRISFRAAPGEANRVVVTQIGADGPPLVVRIADGGAPVVAGPGCVAETPSRVVCTGQAGWGTVDLGDNDDELTATTNASGSVDRVDAGPGDDRISGDVLVQHGDGDADVLTAGTVQARLVGGPGADTLIGGPAFDDILTGGPGDDELRGDMYDSVDYADHTVGVTVDLEVGIGGSTGERDRIVDVPHYLRVIGSDGDDVLQGSAASERFDSRAGDDEIRGNDGDDVIEAGPGDDFVAGGMDSDYMNGQDGFDIVDYSDHAYTVGIHLDGSTFSGGVEDRELGWSDQIQEVEGGIGGDGDDLLVGGPADNVMAGGPGADVVRGGPGFDHVAYADHDVGVTVDLDGQAGDDGALGEGDTVWFDVEGIVGGSGSDSLTGSGVQNHLLGGPGDDRLDGDALADLVEGEEGDDVIAARDGRPDAVFCGPDDDTVTADAEDDFDACEHVQLPAVPPDATMSTPPPSPPPALPTTLRTPRTTVAPQRRRLVVRVGRIRLLGAREVVVRVPCPATAVGRCRTSATLATRPARGSRAVAAGSRTVTARPGRVVDVRIRLTSAARRRLARRGVLAVRLTITVKDGLGRRVTARRNLTWRRPVRG